MASTNRTGRVSAIDYEAGTYEVTYFDRGQSVTRKINAISNGEYKMPVIGQIVSVAHTSSGLAAATTTGTDWTHQPGGGRAIPGQKQLGQHQPECENGRRPCGGNIGEHRGRELCEH